MRTIEISSQEMQRRVAHYDKLEPLEAQAEFE